VALIFIARTNSSSDRHLFVLALVVRAMSAIGPKRTFGALIGGPSFKLSMIHSDAHVFF